MKFIALQENLTKSLSIVNKFVSTKTQLPVLANILFSLKEGILSLSATDLETGINFCLPVKTEEEGAITVPAKVITDFISSLPNDKVKIEVKQNKLKVVCRNYSASFNGIPASEFPPIPSLKDKDKNKDFKKISLETKSFIKAIKQTAFTAALDESRPVLTGVRISFLNKGLQLVATDGYRLSLKNLNLTKETEIPTLIIPARALMEIARIYGQKKKEEVMEISLAKENNQIIFSLGEIEIVTRLLEGKFPDFKKIIPQKELTKITINREDFQRAVKTASLFAKDSANIVKLKIKDQKLKIMANAPEIGENKIELEIKKTGEDSQIAFNCRFLQDYLNVLEEDSFVMEFSGPLKPGLFKPVKETSFFHIIMPVRIQE